MRFSRSPQFRDTLEWLCCLGLVAATLLFLLAACGGGGGGTVESQNLGTSTYVRTYGRQGADRPIDLAALSDGGLAFAAKLGSADAFRPLTENWLSVVNGIGMATAQFELPDNEGGRAEVQWVSSKLLEAQNQALFSGSLTRANTGEDAVVRLRDSSSTTLWETVLDSGPWGGNTQYENSGSACCPPAADDKAPRLRPVFDANGQLLGLYAVSQSYATVTGPALNGRHREVYSVVVWYLNAAGEVVSRNRLFSNALDPLETSADLLSDAEVLPNGSLVVALQREYQRSPVTLLRVGQSGGTGVRVQLPLDEYPEFVSLQSLPEGVLVLSRLAAGLVDLSAQSLIWSRPLSEEEREARLRLSGIAEATVVDGQRVIVLGRESFSGDVSLSTHYLLNGNRVLPACALPGARFLSDLRLDSEGSLSALVVNRSGYRLLTLSGADCRLAREQALGDFGGFAESTTQARLSATAQSLIFPLPFRIAHFQTDGQVLSDIKAQDLSNPGISNLAESGQHLLALRRSGGDPEAIDLLQRFDRNGRLLSSHDLGVGTGYLTGDAQGRAWLFHPRCGGTLLRVDEGGEAECLLDTPRLQDIAIPSRAADGSVWISTRVVNGFGVATEFGEQVFQVGPEDQLRAYPRGCALAPADSLESAYMDIGARQERVSAIGLRGTQTHEYDICRVDAQGREWKRGVGGRGLFDGNLDLLHASSTSSLENGTLGTDDGPISRYSARSAAVAAEDGGVAVLFSVKQNGPVPGLRSEDSLRNDEDIGLLKLDAEGHPQWLRVYGGARNDFPYDLKRMADGGYAILGQSDSFDALTPGSREVLLIRTGPDGHVARTTAGGDACPVCLGSITGANLLQLMGSLSEQNLGPAVDAGRLEWTPVDFVSPRDLQTRRLPGITDGRSCSGAVTDQQEAGVRPEAPGLDFSVRNNNGSNSLRAGDSLQFIASATANSAGSQPNRLEWDFLGNGEFTQASSLENFVYSRAGRYQVVLRVSYADGSQARVQKPVVIDSAAAGGSLPVARFSAEGEGGQPAQAGGNAVIFDARASSPFSEIVRYDWDYQTDGIVDCQQTMPGECGGSEMGLARHVYPDPGNYTITLRVLDRFGQLSESATQDGCCAIAVEGESFAVRIQGFDNQAFTAGNEVTSDRPGIRCTSNAQFNSACSGQNLSRFTVSQALRLRIRLAANTRFGGWQGCTRTESPPTPSSDPPLCVIESATRVQFEIRATLLPE